MCRTKYCSLATVFKDESGKIPTQCRKVDEKRVADKEKYFICTATILELERVVQAPTDIIKQ